MPGTHALLRSLPRAVFCAAAVLAAGVCAAAANPHAVTCSARVGFGNVVPRGGRLVPITVTIDNAVQTVEAVLSARQPDRLGNTGMIEQKRVTVPAPSRRVYTILSRLDPDRDVIVEVDFPDEFADYTERIPLNATRKRQVLCLGVPDLLLRQLRFPDYRLCSQAPEDMPTDPRALDAVHTVMGTAAELAQLNGGQARALHSWLLGGGRALVLGRWPSGSPSVLAKLLEEGVTAEPEQAVQRLAAGIVAHVQDAEELMADHAGWPPGLKLIFPKLPPHARELDDFHAGSGLLSGIVQELHTQSPSTPGVFFALVAILGLYLLTIGPLDSLICKVAKRPAATWIVFPVAIAVFSGVAAGFGSGSRGQLLRKTQVDFIDAGSRSTEARLNSVCWLYSPRPAGFHIKASQPHVAVTVRPEFFNIRSSVPVTVQQDQYAAVDTHIPAYAAKCLDAHGTVPWPPSAVACQDKGDITHVTLPPELDVESAYLASETGLAPLVHQPGTRRWNTTGIEWSWPSFLEYAGRPWAAPSRHLQAYGPSRAWLSRYMVWISFARPLTEEEATDGHRPSRTGAGEFSGGMFADINTIFGATDPRIPSGFHMRDGREAALNISERLARGGRVLLLFPKADWAASVAGLHVRDAVPHTLRVSLVRLQLPVRQETP